MMKKWSAALKYQVQIIEILLLIISMNLRTSFTCVCYEPAGNMIEKIIVTCGSPMDASGWVEALGKDQAQVTVMNGPSSKSQITQVCSCLLMLGICGHRSIISMQILYEVKRITSRCTTLHIESRSCN